MSKKLNRVTPESRGIPSSAIGRFIDDIKEKGLELHSFMMQRGGDVVAEAWWKPYAPDAPHELYSLSKSFASTAVGFAVQEGLLTVDDYVLKFFPDFENPCANLKKMKVKHLLSMNTGHSEDTTDKVFMGKKDCVTNFLEIDVENEPGTHFLYNTGATYVLSAIVQKLVGKNINDYLDEKLYKPLSIEYPVWDTCPQGISLGGFGLNLTTEDIMKFSIFLQNKGMWEGKRLLNKEWIEEATSVQSDNRKGENQNPDWCVGYGYQFWMSRHGAYRGDGMFGQYMIVMNEQNTSIAITSGLNDMHAVLDSVWDILLPALGDGELAENVKEKDDLVAKLDSLEYSVEYNEIADTVQSKIDGKVYKLSKNDFGLKCVGLSFADDGAKVLMEFDAQRTEAKVGHGKREYGKMYMPSYLPRLANVTISGTWISRDEYKVSITYYETPFVLTSLYKFDGDKLILTNCMNLGFFENKPMVIEGNVK